MLGAPAIMLGAPSITLSPLPILAGYLCGLGIGGSRFHLFSKYTYL